MMLRLAPITLVALLVLPVTAGLAMVLLPAFGYLPVIGREQLSLDPGNSCWPSRGWAARCWSACSAA